MGNRWILFPYNKLGYIPVRFWRSWFCGGECRGKKASTPDIKTWRIQDLHRQRDHYSIGQYTSCHEVATSVITWKKNYPNLNGSTMRGFKKRCEVKLKEASRKNVSPKKKLANKMCERPTLLAQKPDTFVQKFQRATRYKGAVVNT